MNAYHNMSGSPRTMVHQEVNPVGRQIVFGIHAIDFSSRFPQPKEFSSPQEWLDDFLTSHKAELDCVLRPTGFIIGTLRKEEDADKLCRDAKTRITYRFCKDPILTISVLGRVAGNIYIPHRQITLGAWFDNGESYILPARYFPQDSF